ncbi:phage tail protein [Streptacidiphilus anmyonensis]|uniref:phage tail protein n=1 Tax=Streptacidiphilus anmyonensis TaxID=405782 RepID=UPI0005A9B8C9|nr:phage tail protein [Streptacidiphilus anmyonensis]
MSSPHFPPAPPPSEQHPIVSAPVFVISSNIQILGTAQKLDSLRFQELAGINSEVGIEQYVSAGIGGVNHAKQFGLTKPPTVTLKRGLDNSQVLWYWHQMAVAGRPDARAQFLSLDIFAAGATGKEDPLMSYLLVNAWCAKISISSAKAGEGVVTEDVTIACDQILSDDPKGGSPRR